MKNEYVIDHQTQTVVITLNLKNSDKRYTVIDLADLPLIDSFPGKWTRLLTKEKLEYALTSVQRLGVSVTYYMSRVITNAPDGVLVDHKDGQTLNNRRTNLQFVTSQGNQIKSKLGKESRLDRVYPCGRNVERKGNRWRVRICGTHIGSYLTQAEAEAVAQATRERLNYERYGRFLEAA